MPGLLIPIVGTTSRLHHVAAEVGDAVAGHAAVVRAGGADELRAVLDPLAEVPLAVVMADGEVVVDDLVDELSTIPALATCGVVVMSYRDEETDISRTVDTGRMLALVVRPTAGIAGWMVGDQLHDWAEERGVRGIREPAMPGSSKVGTGSDFLRYLESDEQVITDQLVAYLERALGPRTRIHMPAGVRFTRQGEQVEGVYVVLSGTVALTRQTRTDTLLLHHASTGPVVGLMALVSRRTALFTATTTTEVEAIHLSLGQIDRALRLEPGLASLFAVLSMRSLTARLRRSEELQVERNDLNRELDAERRRLGTALKELQDARVELVSQARFAMLGELSAGVAHELNNPVAAILGAVSHLRSDVEHLTAGHPDEELLDRVMRTAAEREAVSTAVERKARRAIEARIGDPERSFRLVAAGILDPELAAAIPQESLDRVEASAAVGTATRNIQVATARIGELVHSLRAYSRPEGEMLDDVDVQVTIEDTLHLLSHRLRGITVEREYSTLPRITARPSQLGQVWTNIIVNAADALDGEGHITITTSAEGGYVRVDIADDGSGIDSKTLPHIFEPRFSTKQGTVRYGLGLGLGISRRIVEEHGGTLTACSEPGLTVMSAILPIAGPTKESA